MDGLMELSAPHLHARKGGCVAGKSAPAGGVELYAEDHVQRLSHPRATSSMLMVGMTHTQEGMHGHMFAGGESYEHGGPLT